MSPASPQVAPPSTDPIAGGARRPLKSRDTHWARTLAGRLARAGVSPNAISLFSVACAALAGAAFVSAGFSASPWHRAGLYILAVIGIQSRLLCNLLDGMVAVEHGKASPTGEIYNDLPDRFADVIVFAAVGYCAGGAVGVSLGWAAAVMAVLTAYVRVLGKSIGASWNTVRSLLKLKLNSAKDSGDELEELCRKFTQLTPDTAAKVMQFYKLREHAAAAKAAS